MEVPTTVGQDITPEAWIELCRQCRQNPAAIVALVRTWNTGQLRSLNLAPMVAIPVLGLVKLGATVAARAAEKASHGTDSDLASDARRRIVRDPEFDQRTDVERAASRARHQ